VTVSDNTPTEQVIMFACLFVRRQKLDLEHKKNRGNEGKGGKREMRRKERRRTNFKKKGAKDLGERVDNSWGGIADEEQRRKVKP